MDLRHIQNRILGFSDQAGVARLSAVTSSFRKTAIHLLVSEVEQFFDDILIIDHHNIFEKYAGNRNLIMYIYGLYQGDFVSYALMHNDKLLLVLAEEYIRFKDAYPTEENPVEYGINVHMVRYIIAIALNYNTAVGKKMTAYIQRYLIDHKTKWNIIKLVIDDMLSKCDKEFIDIKIVVNYGEYIPPFDDLYSLASMNADTSKYYHDFRTSTYEVWKELHSFKYLKRKNIDDVFYIRSIVCGSIKEIVGILLSEYKFPRAVMTTEVLEFIVDTCEEYFRLYALTEEFKHNSKVAYALIGHVVKYGRLDLLDRVILLIEKGTKAIDLLYIYDRNEFSERVLVSLIREKVIPIRKAVYLAVHLIHPKVLYIIKEVYPREDMLTENVMVNYYMDGKTDTSGTIRGMLSKNLPRASSTEIEEAISISQEFGLCRYDVMQYYSNVIDRNLLFDLSEKKTITVALREPYWYHDFTINKFNRYMINAITDKGVRDNWSFNTYGTFLTLPLFYKTGMIPSDEKLFWCGNNLAAFISLIINGKWNTTQAFDCMSYEGLLLHKIMIDAHKLFSGR
jgi:hypothetical protein